MQPTPYYDTVNPDLLRLIPPDAKRIVEVGCMGGSLAREYRAQHPDCHYVGVESQPSYARLAEGNCTQVLCADIERLEDGEFARLFPSDCWIFGDVLEHLYDPWDLIARIRQRSNTGSRIVACTPNAQHWSVQAHLVAGEFWYRENGLFDRTHIRWFTAKTIAHLFQSNGYRIASAINRYTDAPRLEVELALKTLALSLGVNAEQAAKEARVFQYVVNAEAI
ncbi:MAG: class I SAM-dependent methyltransferase [Nevskia sp.]|nr:class I SAM-dependent methyltransferase [Nevskia sp.]